MTTARTYIFAGGGTGGHLFPGIAVAQELQHREPEARMLFVGSDKDLEQSILARYRLEHQSLPVESLRTLTRRPLHFLRRNWQAWRSARQLIRNEQPSVVIGLGGYASAPIVWTAARARIPVVLLEQNVIPGRTTRWLSRSAALVCISFPEATSRLPSTVRVEVTGNPLRREIAALKANHSDEMALQRELLVLGGSQGADSLNDAVAAAVQLLRDELSTWRIFHQAGPRQVEKIRGVYEGLSLATTVQPFFEDMAERYRAASMVVSRAGATTLAELTCAGLPMVLLPYPQAADNHQSANAKSLRDHGAAVIVEHRQNVADTSADLAKQLRPLLADSVPREIMRSAALHLARPDAASAVASHVQSLVR